MKKLPLVVIFSASVFFLCSCASSPVFPEKQKIPQDIAGIVHAGDSRTQKEFDYLNYLEISWVFHSFSWATVEYNQDEWNFVELDEIVDKARESGLKVIGTIAYDIWWIHDDKEAHRNITPQHLPLFLEYVKKTTEHFKGRVDAWCIWNEPNFSRFWRGTQEDFFELTRQTADTIREIDSEVKLIGGSFNRGVFGLPEKFIRGLFESGAMEKVDAVAFHPYEINPARALSLYNKFKRIVDDYGFGDKIWLTEVGYPTGGWYPTKVNEKNFPEYVVKTFVNLSAAGATTIFWYHLFDASHPKKNNSEDFFGLVRSREDYTSKGAEALRLCAKYLSGTVCSPLEGEGLPKSLKAFWFNGADSGTLVLWSDSGSRQARLRLPGTDHAMHDPVSGIASPIRAETVIKAGKMPVFITWTDSSLPDGSKPEIAKK